MVAGSASPLRDFRTGSSIDPQYDEGDPTIGSYEPVQPSEAPAQQVRALAPSPNRLMLVGGGVAAAFAGGAIGYWLGRRSAPRPVRRFRKVAGSVESVMDLAPVAMNLLGNPLIRAIALRILLRQLSRRMDH
jgi:hypothetical protein